MTRRLHEKAMEYADTATISKANGNEAESIFYYKLAYNMEKEVAAEMGGADPTSRFIILRSAASLAYKAGLYFEAKKIINRTLTENPPQFIINELKDIENLIISKTKKGNGNKLQIKDKVAFINILSNEIIIEDRKLHSYNISVPETNWMIF